MLKFNTAVDKKPVLIYKEEEAVCILPYEGEKGAFVFLPSSFDIKDFQIAEEAEVSISDHSVVLDGKTYSIADLKGVSSLFVTVQSGEMEKVKADPEKKEKARALFSFYDENGNAVFSEYGTIKGRGNTSWRFYDKKPYNISFDHDVSILDLGEDRNWCLLANAADESQMDNALVSDFASKLDLQYVPGYEYVNVFIDGEYEGLYLFSEKAEVSSDRLNIDRASSYLLETDLNSRMDRMQNAFVSEGNNIVEIHYPSKIDSSKREEIKRKVNSLEAALRDVNSEEWKQLIDIDSWARIYLLDELFENVDGGYCSVFFYLDESGKFKRGPLWDYDRCFADRPDLIMAGNEFKYGNEISLSYNYYLLQREEFRKRVVEIFEEEFQDLLEHFVREDMEKIQTQIEDSYKADCFRWNLEASDHREEKLSFLEQRSLFLKDYFENPERYCHLQIEDELYYFHNYIVEKGGNISSIEGLDTDLLRFVLYNKKTGIPFDASMAIREDLSLVRGQDYDHLLPDLRGNVKESAGFVNSVFIVSFLYCFVRVFIIMIKRINDGKVSS